LQDETQLSSLKGQSSIHKSKTLKPVTCEIPEGRLTQMRQCLVLQEDTHHLVAQEYTSEGTDANLLNGNWAYWLSLLIEHWWDCGLHSLKYTKFIPLSWM